MFYWFLPYINMLLLLSASVVSDSVWPHRRQPTRLPRPWDSPGKNTGVGCHFLLQCMKVKVKLLSWFWLFETPWTAAHQAPPSMGFSRQEYWSGVPLPSPIHQHESATNLHMPPLPWTTLLTPSPHCTPLDCCTYLIFDIGLYLVWPNIYEFYWT